LQGGGFTRVASPPKRSEKGGGTGGHRAQGTIRKIKVISKRGQNTPITFHLAQGKHEERTLKADSDLLSNNMSGKKR